MITWMGTHFSEPDFPLLAQARYETLTSACVELHFGDIIYQLPAMVMHYLDDEESLGWTWLPPKPFIDRVMNGGKIQLTVSRLENLTIQRDHIGYLRKGSGNYAGMIVDTKGGDANYDHAKPVTLGRAPEAFIDRMKRIIEAAKNKLPHIILELAEGYECCIIPRVAPKLLSFNDLIYKLMLEDLASKNLEPDIKHMSCGYYYIIPFISFFRIRNDIAVANPSLIAETILEPFIRNSGSSGQNVMHALNSIIASIFAKLGIQLDLKANPILLTLSGENLKRFESLGGKVNALLSFKDKLSAITGHVIESVHVEKHKILVEPGRDAIYSAGAIKAFFKTGLLPDAIIKSIVINNQNRCVVICAQTTDHDKYRLEDNFIAHLEYAFRQSMVYQCLARHKASCPSVAGFLAAGRQILMRNEVDYFYQGQSFRSRL